MATYDVTAIGESMLRYSVPAGERIRTASQLDIFPAGAETNVLAALAQIGRKTAFGGALSANPLGKRVAWEFQAFGIDLTPTVWMENKRMGVYYVEFSTPPRPLQVTYDRADSCATALTSEHVHWDTMLDTQMLHITGITAALSSGCYDLVIDAAARAASSDVICSFDVNYRSKLWSPEEAGNKLRPILEKTELLFCKRQDAATLFGIDGEIDAVLNGLHEISGARWVVCTDGADGVYALADGDVHHRSSVEVGIVDRIGAGDALAAGVIDGYLRGDIAHALEYGVIMAALCLSQYGDMVTTSRDEVEMIRERGVLTSPQR